MEESNLIIEVCIIAVSSFLLGFLFAIYNIPKKKKKKKKRQQSLGDLYCLECEIETPVRIKNNNAYCKNCGLHHGEIL